MNNNYKKQHSSMRRHYPQHESTPPKQFELAKTMERDVSRRAFLRRAGKVAVAGATIMTGDTLWGEFLWRHANPEIHLLDPSENEKQPTDTATLVIGGFGVSNTESLANAVRPGLADRGAVAYLKNSNDGINMETIADTTRQFISDNNIETLRLYGHSMGGMMAVALAARIQEDVDLEAIMLDCSPASYKDVRSTEQIGTWLLQTTDDLSLHMGPIARFGMETLNPIIDGRDDYLEICAHAIRKISKKGCSNELIQAQASFIRNFNASDYAGVFPHELPILRLRPDNYSADHTVNNETSLPRWRRGLRHDITDVIVKNGGHANPNKQPVGYTNTLQQTAAAYSFSQPVTTLASRGKRAD